MAGRVAPGGNATISLGNESSQAVFAERQRDRGAAVETPAATARFPQAPGGNSSIVFGAAADVSISTGRPFRGTATITLGSDPSESAFAGYAQSREAPVATLEASRRFPQAPGGSSTLYLGGAPPDAVLVRGPVGGPVSVCFGTETPESRFEKPATIEHEPLEAAARFPQAPGGTSHLCFGDSGECEAHVVRGPVGGKTSIVLGGNSAEEQEVRQRTARPVGGADSVRLGADESQHMFAEEDRRRAVEIETPEPAARFTQAPGGNSTVCLGGDDPQAQGLSRGPVGGADTLSLTFDAHASCDIIRPRGPVGGSATVVFGGDSHDDVWAQCDSKRSVAVETPDACPRFPQAPGGTSSIELGGNGAVSVLPSRGPVGGQSTVEFGTEIAADVFALRRSEREKKFETPNAPSRFSQAPGGNSSNDFAAEPTPVASPSRGPVGGTATLVLGSADTRAEFQLYAAQRAAPSETPDATRRFPQAPGGNATIVLGGAVPESVVSVRGPVGGAATLSFGDEAASEAYDHYGKQHMRLVATPDAAPRFPQAPGGASSIDFSAPLPNMPVSGGLPVGGKDMLVLGIDNTRALFDERHAERNISHETPDAAFRFPQAPGGTATIKLGGPAHASESVPRSADMQRVAPGGNSALVLGGGYPHDLVAQGLASAPERSSTRRVAAPGGNSTICLGSCDSDAGGVETHVSSNKFACGANQNAGNMLTDRPTTRLHQAPGGDSTLQLGGSYPNDMEAAFSSDRRRCQRLLQSPGGNSTLHLGDESAQASAPVSSNKFACGASQNSGNVITDRPSTRVQHAPGGASTICLGAGDENVDTSNLVVSGDAAKKLIRETPVKSFPSTAARLSERA